MKTSPGIMELAVDFLMHCQALGLKGALKTRLTRASAAVLMNLAQAHRLRGADGERYAAEALRAARECQEILAQVQDVPRQTVVEASHLGAGIFRLTRAQTAA